MGKSKKKLFCPNCHSVEFVEEAECAAVNRDFRVPEDPEEPITYGHEYSQGDIEHITYACRKCGLMFQSQDEEEFRKELQMLNELFDGPVWFVKNEEVHKGVCEGMDNFCTLYVQPDGDPDGRFWEPNLRALFKTREAAEKVLKNTLEYRAQEIQKKIAEEKARWEELTEQLKELEKKLNWKEPNDVDNPNS